MVLSLILFVAGLAQGVTAKSITVAAPVRVAEIDAGKLKGEPTELAWSPDLKQLFLQTSQRDSRGMMTNPRFFVMAAAEGRPESAAAKPDWEADYWSWKSGHFAPGSKTWGIDVKEEQRMQSATASPMGGTLAKGGTADPSAGSSMEDATRAANQMQRVHVFTLDLKGETVGEFVNQQFIPGYTFSWSPQPLGLIAFVNAAGRLTLMDQQGQKQQIESTRNVVLPAWSADGTRLAFLQRTGKNKFDLYVANVTK
jgi:hypothetical protein